MCPSLEVRQDRRNVAVMIVFARRLTDVVENVGV